MDNFHDVDFYLREFPEFFQRKPTAQEIDAFVNGDTLTMGPVTHAHFCAMWSRDVSLAANNVALYLRDYPGVRSFHEICVNVLHAPYTVGQALACLVASGRIRRVRSTYRATFTYAYVRTPYDHPDNYTVEYSAPIGADGWDSREYEA